MSHLLMTTQVNASLPPRSPTHASTPGSSGDEDEWAENTAPQVDECWMISNGNNHVRKSTFCEVF